MGQEAEGRQGTENRDRLDWLQDQGGHFWSSLGGQTKPVITG